MRRLSVTELVRSKNRQTSKNSPINYIEQVSTLWHINKPGLL